MVFQKRNCAREAISHRLNRWFRHGSFSVSNAEFSRLEARLVSPNLMSASSDPTPLSRGQRRGNSRRGTSLVSFEVAVPGREVRGAWPAGSFQEAVRLQASDDDVSVFLHAGVACRPDDIDPVGAQAIAAQRGVSEPINDRLPGGPRARERTMDGLPRFTSHVTAPTW